MKKIRLHVDELEVLSFSTQATPKVRGTVQGANTGHPCYVTVAVVNTHCAAYPASYWGEDTCTCPAIPYTDPRYCIQVGPTVVDPTCFTCPGVQPGC